MIISDITLLTNTFIDDVRAYALRATPIGNGPWRPFITGDYETDGMVVRYRLTSFAQSTYTIRDIDVTVDVEDILERRQDTPVSSSGFVSVAFDRQFHQPPQVYFTSHSTVGATGSEAPVFENITINGFDVKITDGATDFDGLVDWIAHGY